MSKNSTIFDEIITSIQNNDFSGAAASLNSFVSADDPKIVARANYLLGYIYSHWDNKDRNEHLARRYLLNNLNSDYPVPSAYVLYADLVEDKNIALNYLKSGVTRYPENTHLYRSLLHYSVDKGRVVDKIQQAGFSDTALLINVIEYLIETGQWDKTGQFINRIQSNQNLSKSNWNYLNLLKAYSLIFCDDPNYGEAYHLFKDVFEKDVDNDLAYSPYLGAIFSLMNAGRIGEATTLFDVIPLFNVIHDLNDGPWSFVNVNFEKEYKIIFNSIIASFSKDSFRRSKAKALYVLYLYYPFEIYGICRFKKADIKSLESYSKKNGFNKYIATALFNMHCHFRQYVDASHAFMSFLLHYKNPEDSDIFYSAITESVETDMLQAIVKDMLEEIEKVECYDEETFASTAFTEIVKILHEEGNYTLIAQLADCLSDNVILSNSGCAFECAYAYDENNSERAQSIYQKLINKEPNNVAALNNLGVIYKRKGSFEDAYNLFKKAHDISPKKELYINNLHQVEEKISEQAGRLKAQKERDVKLIAKNLTLDFFEGIGYTDELRTKLSSIQDPELQSVLLRDLQECAISIATGQDKSATILCGSIIEALLLAKIGETGKKNYDISSISNGKKAASYPIAEMGLYELLYVADMEKLICKSNFHLSHYVRDYRNIVHPAKEVRIKQSVTHENTMMMWTILKQLINELL